MDKLVGSPTRAVGLLALTTVLFFAPAAQADLIVNGSFESATDDPGGHFLELPPGSTVITGWTVGADGIDYIGGYWEASDGGRSLDLSGPAAGEVMAQSFLTTTGSQYEVTFDMAGNPDGSPPLKWLRVVAAGDFADFSFDTTGHSRPSMGWEARSWTFTATAATTTLAFESLTDTPFGAALDNVSVRLIPAPGAALLGMIGLAGIGWIRRRLA